MGSRARFSDDEGIRGGASAVGTDALTAGTTAGTTATAAGTVGTTSGDGGGACTVSGIINCSGYLWAFRRWLSLRQAVPQLPPPLPSIDGNEPPSRCSSYRVASAARRGVKPRRESTPCPTSGIF